MVALTTNVIAANLIVWKKLKAKNYAIVLALSEMFLQYVFISFFQIVCSRCNIFTKRLSSIALNEMHLI